jgi:hypothetical protein
MNAGPEDIVRLNIHINSSQGCSKAILRMGEGQMIKSVQCVLVCCGLEHSKDEIWNQHSNHSENYCSNAWLNIFICWCTHEGYFYTK